MTTPPTTTTAPATIVTADLQVEVDSDTELAIQVAVAAPDTINARETIELTLDGAPLSYTEIAAPTGGRLWLSDAGPGSVELHYRAELDPSTAAPQVMEAERLAYLRASRYCESDRMGGLAGKLFRDVGGPADLLAAVSSWVGTTLDYVSGSSGPTDGAVDTLLAGQGVCRDFAHLTVCLLRSMGIPARLAAVYAPGLDPMDFHAVAEALVDDAWWVVDSTLLAPRSSLVRIATGRDAADTAFLSNAGGHITLSGMQVTAVVGGNLPTDDVQTLVSLA